MVRMNKKLIAIGFSALSLLACGPKEKVETMPPADVSDRLNEAQALYEKSGYVPLKKAFSIYDRLYAQRSMRGRVAVPLLKTALLLAAREKEIGIKNETYLNKAMNLVEENPSLSGFKPYVKLTGLLSTKEKGVMQDVDMRFWAKATQDDLEKNVNEIAPKALSDEFTAYFYLAWNCFYKDPYKERKDLSEIEKRYPSSLLIKYKTATCYEEIPEALNELLYLEPEFYEASYHLGDLSIKAGRLVEAENRLLRAYQGIPESPQTTILLGSIYLATEEYEKSLEFYDKTLVLAPEYRDALLGKAICFSTMKRHEEAADVCEKIIALGYWLLGESYYWLAWNQHELGKNAEALQNIDQSKGRLPTNSEVFSLAGTIAVELGETDRAEKDFNESLKYNASNTESLFGLANIYAKREKWVDSGGFFEKASHSLERAEAATEARILEIEKSTLSEERKKRLVEKKKDQLRAFHYSKASAFYSAAAAWLNGGMRDKALDFAGRASEHPGFKQKAEELISQIKVLR